MGPDIWNMKIQSKTGRKGTKVIPCKRRRTS